MGRTFGYARVSSKNQFEDRQLLSMKSFHIEAGNLYIDKQSGKNFDRPAYRQMLRRLKGGDLLVLKSIDRLGRNYQEMLDQWQLLTRKKNVDIAVLDMPLLDTRRDRDLLGTFISDLVLQLLSYVAHNEREAILQRQKEGIEAARYRGVRFGRPPIEAIPELALQVIRQWRDGRITQQQACAKLGVSQRTLYRRWKELELDQ